MRRLRSIAGIVILFAFAAHAAVRAADALAQLGVSEAQAKDALMTSLTYGRLPLGLMGQAFVKLPPDARGALVTEFASWARAYTSSPEFKAAYAQNRAAKKPTAPDPAWQKAWEEQFPEDPQTLIVRRLREFQKECADVNFDARVDTESGLFEEPRYEQQSNEWKLCYRAGREAVTAGRSIASAWLGSTKPSPK
jgi:hypothetical protein